MGIDIRIPIKKHIWWGYLVFHRDNDLLHIDPRYSSLVVELVWMNGEAGTPTN